MSLHRLVAFFTLLCLLLMSFEQVLPDVHDGDGAMAQLAVGSAGDHVVPPHPPGAPQSPASPASPSGHAAHVDHCAHTHLLALSACERTPEPVPDHGARFDTSAPHLRSVSTPPHRRPPIA